MPLSRGERLRRLRQQKGVEQQEAAAGIGIGAPYLSMLERDIKGQGPDQGRAVLRRAAEYYGVMLEYLVVEQPQDYIAAFVREIAVDALPYSFGGRLALVLAELQRRWGEEEFSAERMAVLLGTTPELLSQYLSDALQVTDTAAHQLSAATGAPLHWLVPQQGSPPDPAAPFQHAVKLAMENGMQPKELETLIQVWLAAQQNRPSGKTP